MKLELDYYKSILGERRIEVLKNWNKSGNTRRTAFHYKNLKKGRYLNFFSFPQHNKKYADQIDKIISVLNNKFEDNWDFILEPRSYNGTFKYTLYVVILYPEVEISNSEGLKRNLKDLLVTFAVRPNTFNLDQITFEHPLGTRASLYTDEYISEYLHSHLPCPNFRDNGSYEKLNFTHFCIGNTTELNSLLLDFSDDSYSFDENLFELYLHLIDSLIEWESLEGVPFRMMSQITSSTNSNFTIKNLSKNYIELDVIKPHIHELIKSSFLFTNRDKLEFYFENGEYKIYENKFFTELIKDFLLTVGLKRYIIKETNFESTYYIHYINVRENLASDFTEECSSNSKIYFRDKEIVFSVLTNEEENDENKFNIEHYKIHPQVLNQIKKRLENEIKTNAIRYNSFKRANPGLYT